MNRFWSKVDIGGPDDCWEWKASVSRLGYGQFGYRGSVVKAHRFSMYLSTGAMPELCVLHRCDNRKCVNPSHLFPGSQVDNIKDMVAKGRNVPPSPGIGESNTGARLSEQDVRGALCLLRLGESQRVVARLLGVTPMTINRISMGTAWNHVKL